MAQTDPVNFNDPRGLMLEAPTFSITVTAPAMGLGDLEFWWALTRRNWIANPGGGGGGISMEEVLGGPLEGGGGGSSGEAWRPIGYNGALKALKRKDCYGLFGFRSPADAQGAFGKVEFRPVYLGQLQVTWHPNGTVQVALGTPPPAQAQGNVVSVNYNYSWIDFSTVVAVNTVTGASQRFDYLAAMNVELGTSMTTAEFPALILLHEFMHTPLGGKAPQKTSNTAYNLPIYEKCLK